MVLFERLFLDNMVDFKKIWKNFGLLVYEKLYGIKFVSDRKMSKCLYLS